MIDRIHKNLYIFGNNNLPMETVKVKLPRTKEEKFPEIYSYQTWQNIKEEIQETGRSKKLIKLSNHVLHEIPQQVWQNPICYSYMLDRNFGFTKKLWWEIVPKEEWSTIDFSKLNNTILKKFSLKLNSKNQVIYDDKN
ncbi:hypothetical protein BCR36DRAFT_366341 [Piromyces finnis]|uniref:Uncharacterized protein n=1 Tax=Piromyces finnis TaxID=1754191 RepID=A0A1Y1VLY0_9FUNG|nr:hypothetical protein BCR36DRAFT_366341 [Piromyces finnis]|eukprot:ORX59155.1 hypothetical protein BCR36DRAFT_366341 [Piromyces finnis]